jgi:hypothetical protein
LDLNFEPADHIVLTRSHHFLSAEADSHPRFTSLIAMV